MFKVFGEEIFKDAKKPVKLPKRKKKAVKKTTAKKVTKKRVASKPKAPAVKQRCGTCKKFVAKGKSCSYCEGKKKESKPVANPQPVKKKSPSRKCNVCGKTYNMSQGALMCKPCATAITKRMGLE